MKKGMSTRQLKRQHGVNVQEIFSLYEEMKEGVSLIEGNVAKKKDILHQSVDFKKIMEELNLKNEDLTVKDVLGMLKGKMKKLDEKIFELKQGNEVLKYTKKPTISIKLYSEKAHD